MRRRFGRRRRSQESARPALDAERELARLVQAGAVPADSLEPVEDDDGSAALAAVGRGTADGSELIAAVAPTSGGDAWLAGTAAALRRAETAGFGGRLLLFSPHWSGADRRRLGWLRDAPFRVEAYVDPAAGSPAPVEAEPAPLAPPPTLDALATAGPDAAWRRRYALAAAALEGLAAKHGGAWRPGWPESRLLLVGQPVAALRAAGGALELETLEPRRERRALAEGDLADALDRLEGSLRKFLSDRRVRDGEAGRRALRAGRLREALGARDVVLWPVPGVDWLGVDGDDRPVVAAAPEALSLEALGAALDGYATLADALPLYLAAASPPLRLDAPWLALAAEEVAAPAQRLLGALAVDAALVDLRDGRRVRPDFAPAATAEPRAPRERPAPPAESARGPVGEPAAADGEAGREEGAEAPGPRRFEEVSLFDLGEEETRREGGSEGGRRRRRRRRGRSRGGSGEGRSAASDDSETDEGEGDEQPSPRREREPREPRRGRRGRGRGRRRAIEAEDEDEDIAEAVALSDDEEVELERLEPPPLPEYDDDEDEDAGGPAGEAERAPARPRRRAALVAHADRGSIGAAVLLARDLRLVEGLWVYPQEDLMTFFRSVATDLREDTPIYVVGFTASPSRDVLQAASLYRERLTWFDHHEWPPEDLGALRDAIGEASVHVEPGAGTPMPAVLAECSRRSRFSDKLLDVLTGRFSAHDWERWGHLWWWRLGELAKRPGEHRREIDALLSGRPSDLAREASGADDPPPPDEAAYVAGRDFPLTYFGGYVLVRVEVPPGLDPALTARIARERYAARLSVTWETGTDRVVLDAEDSTARRVLNRSAMVEHLAQKFGWVEPLPDADHVARIRARGLDEDPSRIDDLVAEIAMGRSILEG